jgi:hypothetical protein
MLPTRQRLPKQFPRTRLRRLFAPPRQLSTRAIAAFLAAFGLSASASNPFGACARRFSSFLDRASSIVRRRTSAL